MVEHLQDGQFCGTGGADEGGRGGAGPVSVAEQVQPGLVDGAGAVGAGHSRAVDGEVQWVEVAQVGLEPGAPDDHVGRAGATVVPGDPGVRWWNIGSGRTPRSRAARTAGTMTMSQSGDAAGVGAAVVQGERALGGDVEQDAPVDVVGQEPRWPER